MKSPLEWPFTYDETSERGAPRVVEIIQGGETSIFAGWDDPADPEQIVIENIEQALDIRSGAEVLVDGVRRGISRSLHAVPGDSITFSFGLDPVDARPFLQEGERRDINA